MSRLNSLVEKLENQKNVIATTISNIAWSGLVQKASTYPFDFIIFDIEHGTLSIESIEESLRIARLTDLPAVVRVPDSIPHIISKTLDMGADGILLPRIEKIAQVETALNSSRYFPKGRKGCGGFSNLREEDDMSVHKYNKNRLIFIQIESKEGLLELPLILSKYKHEIAGVIIGPYDASIMLETPFKISCEAMINFIKNVFNVCKEEKISSGIFVDNADMIKGYKNLGANIFWVGTEISLICEGYENILNAFDNLNNF
jgi:4-hydroxy-2-oxoheptanedioate aldolase